ncbi:MAG: hypothetical protein PHY92_01655 [Alphaproteobacteria bacterium]|nr:hypothetical protein [Alphaproteobacteria bacterium]
MMKDTDHFMISGQLLALAAFCLFAVLGVLSPTQAWAAPAVLSPSSTSSASSDGVCDPEDPCDPDCDGESDGTMSEAARMNAMANAYTTGAMAAAQTQFRSMQIKDGGACMLKLMTYFDQIGSILSGTITLIGAILIGLLKTILTSVCNFIVTGINNLLASICIPVPNLGFSLSLPQLTSQSCDGISLQNFISVTGHPSGLPPLSFGGYSIPVMSLGQDTGKSW